MSHRHMTADLMIAGLPVISAGAMVLDHAIPALDDHAVISLIALVAVLVAAAMVATGTLACTLAPALATYWEHQSGGGQVPTAPHDWQPEQ